MSVFAAVDLDHNFANWFPCQSTWTTLFSNTRPGRFLWVRPSLSICPSTSLQFVFRCREQALYHFLQLNTLMGLHHRPNWITVMVILGCEQLRYRSGERNMTVFFTGNFFIKGANSTILLFYETLSTNTPSNFSQCEISPMRFPVACLLLFSQVLDVSWPFGINIDPVLFLRL